MTAYALLRASCIGIVALLCIASGAADAQDYDRIAPKLPSIAPRAPEITPPAPEKPASEQPDRVVLPELRGLRLLDSIEKVERNGAHEPGLTIAALPLLDAPALRETLSAFIGKPLTFGALDAISRGIVAWYREHDHPFVDVAFPEQDISTGVVQAVVTEFRLGALRIEGNRWFATGLLRDQLRLSPGDPIDAERLKQDLTWLGQNPFRTVDVVAEKSATPGDTDLVLKTEDRFPMRFYAGYANNGTPVLGHDRWSQGFNWGNALWLDHQFSYQFTSSDNFWHSRANTPGQPNDPLYVAHSVNYLIPLPWRDRLLVFGSYERAVPNLGVLSQVGISGQASLRYVVPLRGRPNFSQELQLGYDFKTSNNNLEFGGIQVSNTTTEINQFPVIYTATIGDAYGQTLIENGFYYSPGDLSAGNKNAAFNASQPRATAHYFYDRATLTRITELPRELSWVMRATAQSTDHNLLPSEQLGGGGIDSVRGYDERTANGSIGLLLSEELRSPAFSLGKLLIGPEAGTDQAQLVAFWDFGSFTQKQNLPGAKRSVELESVGLGLRFVVQRYLDFRLDYGWQLREAPTVGVRTHGQFGHVAVTLAY